MNENFTFESANKFINDNIDYVKRFKPFIETKIKNNGNYIVRIPEPEKLHDQKSIQFTYISNRNNNSSGIKYTQGAPIELARELRKMIDCINYNIGKGIKKTHKTKKKNKTKKKTRQRRKRQQK